MRRNLGGTVRAPLLLNVLGLVSAVGAVVADIFHANARVMFAASLGAVACFAVSGIIVFRALRKPRA
jgi:hydroxyethylthiazole kinase-like sugar kinase family protein